MSGHLHHKFAVLQQNLMHGKLPRDLLWEDAVSLVSHLGAVESQGGDEFTFSIREVRVPFKRPHSRQLEIEDISKLRKLIQSAQPITLPSEKGALCQMIVVIDHHIARIFEVLRNGHLHQTDTIQPADPHHFHHHLIHKKEAHYQGDRVPEDSVFYGAIAEDLKKADDIIIVGHGVGKSNAAGVLMEHLKSHAPETARRVRAQEIEDLSALTEPQIEQLAKRYMGSRSDRS